MGRNLPNVPKNPAQFIQLREITKQSPATKYTYCVFWSEEDQAFVGTVAEFPSLAVVEDWQEEAFKGIVEAVNFILEDMFNAGEKPPKPKKHEVGKNKSEIEQGIEELNKNQNREIYKTSEDLFKKLGI